jgi:hypothetical protein
MHYAYRCGDCGKLYDAKEDADACCALTDFVSVCDVCGKDDFDSDVIKECKDSHKNSGS